MVDSFSQIKIIFLPKNTISRLQLLDAGIIQNFKVKYMKRLVKYVPARISENSSATRIIKDVNILMAIQWAQEAWKEVTGTIVKICFEKCGVVKSNDDLMEVEEDGLEFKALVQELYPDMSATEYVYFDTDIPLSEINDDIEEEDDIQEEGVSFVESLAMLDKIKKCSFLDDELKTKNKSQ